ncbi:MAG: hypothetical protein CBB92_03550 [Flammeovirgaceae bacterium TMED32]|nr:NUDIX hydrolase [Rhodospirillaceae bacterium]OUU01251.1 MAG: hypothetical protein CBB92_03550 [Flammeovirgaceae bacterium TMED32]
MDQEFYLFCQSKTRSVPDVEDRTRSLKDKNKRRAQRLGVWMAQHLDWPTLVISSPADRAVTATQKVMKAGGRGADGIKNDERLYSGTVTQLTGLVSELRTKTGPFFITGHLPILEQLAGFLCQEWPSSFRVQFPVSPGLLLHFALTGDPERVVAGCAEFRSAIHADSLPEKFPFPGPDGQEQRDRPAYYYSQSAVIPYRRTDAGLEIMVIMSSKKNHWVIPKGIHDPGMSAQRSAANEAKEEAGVLGDVEDEAAGIYRYEKWGATCSVTVYPMRVERMLSEDVWEESHRTRRWVAPEQAIANLKQDGLKRVVSDFVDRFANRVD